MKILYCIAASFTFANIVLAEESVAVIANPQVTVETLDSGTVTQFFLKIIKTWPNGDTVEAIALDEDSPVHTTFCNKILRRSPAQLRAYWARQMFTGRGFPPKEVKTVAEANTLVEQTQGAISYVGKGDVNGQVKIVFTSRPN